MAIKKDREKYLNKQNEDKDIAFIDLDSVNELSDQFHYLICSYKDPDKLGETYQQKALKYFDSVANLYADKIEQLLKNGYQNVYLVTDHGFVLTGLLEDSDKIQVNFSGNVAKNERFIRAEKKQIIDKNLLIEKQIKYNNFEYCYFSKRLGPFKTPGVYGFSHGGFTPQETIIPFFKWSNNDNEKDALQVIVSNKSDLKEVTGELYALKLNAHSSTDSLFTNERKIILLFFAGNKKVNESDIITITKGEEIKKEYQFGSHSVIDVKVLDAITKEQLDKVTIKQSAARDLGGLL